MEKLKEAIKKLQEEISNKKEQLDILIQALKFIDVKNHKSHPTTSFEKLIVSILEENESTIFSTTDITHALSIKGRNIKQNALSSRLSRLVKAGRIIRNGRGLYGAKYIYREE